MILDEHLVDILKSNMKGESLLDRVANCLFEQAGE